MTPLAVLPLLSCWTAGVLLATAGRRHAARRLAGADLPFRQVLAAQLAGTALNRLVPAGGGLVGAHLALLRRRAADGPHLAAALVGYAAGGALAHLVLTAAAVGLLAGGLVATTASVGVPAVPWWWLLVGCGALAAVLAAVLLVRPGLTVRARDGAQRTFSLVRSRPGTVLQLAGVQTGTALLAAIGLWAALLATGTALSIVGVLTVYLLASTLAAALPVPGGTGPLEAGLVAGLGLVGVAVVPALAGVVLFRLVTHWLPVPLGFAAGAATLRPRRTGRTPAPGLEPA